jgi:hypothetical protein
LSQSSERPGRAAAHYPQKQNPADAGSCQAQEIAGDRHVTFSKLVSGIDKQRQNGNLSSALRLFVLEYYRGKAAEKPSEMLDQQSPPTAPVLL